MILYEDTALVVLDKPAGLSSEDGVPAALRKLWDRPDAYVGVIHRLDTGVSGLMVYAKTPQAAAALSRQVTQSQQVYAEQDGRAEPDAGTPDAPPFVKQYRALIAGGPDEKLPAEGVLRDYLFKDSRKGRVFPVSRPRKGVKEAVLEYRISASAPDGSASLADVTLHTGRTHQIRVQFASRRHPLVGRRQIRQPHQGRHCAPERTAPLHPSRHRKGNGLPPPGPRDMARLGHQTGKRQWNNSIKQILKYTPSLSGRSSI